MATRECDALQGRWYISAGLNSAFDIFPCQDHYFHVPEEGADNAHLHMLMPMHTTADTLIRIHARTRTRTQTRTNIIRAGTHAICGRQCIIYVQHQLIEGVHNFYV